ncbi:MAG: GNAT family N-acetyltransferase [Acetobacteraceae bacterium]|nr:GNAT family N-acetyltransferase [Acetobacteraceae bacterium]
MPAATARREVKASLRRAGPADATLLADHRDTMFAASGVDPAAIAEASGPYRAWLAAALADGTYLGWIAEADGAGVGSIGLWLLPWPHHPKHPATNVRGYVTNMWVVPAQRRKGIGRMLVQQAVAAARVRGITWMALHATDDGAALYRAMGWKAGNEMVLKLS